MRRYTTALISGGFPVMALPAPPVPALLGKAEAKQLVDFIKPRN